MQASAVSIRCVLPRECIALTSNDCVHRDEREAALRMLKDSQEQFSREKTTLLAQCNTILEKASRALHERRSPIYGNAQSHSGAEIAGTIYPEMLSPNQLSDLKRRQLDESRTMSASLHGV